MRKYVINKHNKEISLFFLNSSNWIKGRHTNQCYRIDVEKFLFFEKLGSLTCNLVVTHPATHKKIELYKKWVIHIFVSRFENQFKQTNWNFQWAEILKLIIWADLVDSRSNFQPLIIQSENRLHVDLKKISNSLLLTIRFCLFYMIHTHLNFNEVCLKFVKLLLRTQNKCRKLVKGATTL